MNSPSQVVKTIGDYQFNLSHIIGKGSYGTVYQGVNLKTQETYAIKVIDRKTIQSPDLKNQIELETRIMKQFKHPNLVQLYQVLDSSNNKYIITEYCNGGDLRELLKSRGFFPESEALQIIKDVVSGLQEMVTNNIIHRDLKPANIIKHNSCYKITDFGFSRNFDSLQMMQSLVGTPLYMAPQILLKQTYTNKCDIWSLGMLYYELLVGQTPWMPRTVDELLNMIATKPIVFPADKQISSQSKSFIKCCLQPDEMLRGTWDQIFNHTLFKPFKPVPHIKRERCTSTYQCIVKNNDESNPNSSQSTLQNSSQQKKEEMNKRPETQRPAGPMNRDFYMPMPKIKTATGERMRRTRSQLEYVQQKTEIEYPATQKPLNNITNNNKRRNMKSAICEPPSMENLFKARQGSIPNNSKHDPNKMIRILVNGIDKHITKVCDATPHKELQTLISEHKHLINQGLTVQNIESSMKIVFDAMKYYKQFQTAEATLLLILLRLYYQLLRSYREQKDNLAYIMPNELQVDMDTVFKQLCKSPTNKVQKKLL